jgi:hypothetical protein
MGILEPTSTFRLRVARSGGEDRQLQYGNYGAEFQRCTGHGSGGSFATDRYVRLNDHEKPHLVLYAEQFPDDFIELTRNRVVERAKDFPKLGWP